MELNRNTEIEEFIDTVCKQIKCKEIHEDIKLELADHIIEIATKYISDGISEGEAVHKAISQMGDAAAIGKELNKTHKAKPEWSLLILTLIFVSLGLLTIYFIETKGALSGIPFSMFGRGLFFILFGIIFAFCLYFFDYRKIQKYSKHIYFIILILLIFTIITGRPVNGRVIWITIGPISINFVSMCPYLFAVSLGGIFDKLDFNSSKKILQALILFIVPLILLIASKSLSDAVIYSAVILGVTLASRKSLKLKLIMPGLLFGSLTGLLVLYISTARYRMERFLTFMHPERDPMGMGYINIQLNRIIHTAGLLGNGFTLSSRAIPEIQTDFIFSYIIYTFGWAAAAIFVLLVVTFIIRLVKTALTIKDIYGKTIILSFTAIIATQFLWNILMIFGIAPIASVSLPFISYGGSGIIMNMASLGLILGIYRRKDISRNAVTIW